MSGLSRAAWQAVETKCLASRVTKVQFMLEGIMHIVMYCESLTLDVSSASYLCDVHNNAVCSDRGQPWLSDQGGELQVG